MKAIFTLIAVLITVSAFSQTLHIDSLPATGLRVDSGWRFIAGDNPAYARTDFNDGQWQSAALSNSSSYLPSLSSPKIGWFRLRVVIGSSMLKAGLALQWSQTGASEIFLNGKLFQRSGSIQGSGKYQNYNPGFKPVLLPDTIGDSVLIAIRFASAVPSKLWLFLNSSEAPMDVRISRFDNAVDFYKSRYQQAESQTKFSYLFVALSLLFILLYVFFPRDKINVIFGGFCFFAVTRSYLVYYLSQGSLDVAGFGHASYLLELNDAILGSINLALICQVVFRRIPPFYWLLIGGIGFDLAMIFFLGPNRFQFGFDFLFHVLTVIGFFQLSVLAFRKKIYTIGTVAFFSSVLNLTFFLFYFHIDFIQLNEISINDYVRYSLTINFIMTTLYVAISFARKSKSLELQLGENEKLSRENISKEKEKQQLLAAQNETLEQQVSQRTAELSQSLENLKSTQSQLIQSEKMASLGELTAGIAHEIQNPLNFVNNFSELNRELLEELQQGADRGEIAEVKSIAKDVIDNESKINFHGKRAESIVKGMLQHSRSSTGLKEPVDINSICDEYLKLSYHGLRAKDKDFTAEIVTDFDPAVGKIEAVPQDIGRALLNLFNNAFYAVSEKRDLDLSSQTIFKPLVKVSTKRVESGADRLQATASDFAGRPDCVRIVVSDNGNGIPESNAEKIFQPFFTTKPAGKGTGLGLSLAYDIITKQHQGSIRVASREGEGTDFIIELGCK